MAEMNKKELRKIWNKVPRDYYEKGITKNFFQKLWHTQKWATIRPMIQKDGRRVLDIGCASGWLTAKIAAWLPRSSTTGLDIYPRAISYAKTKHPQIKFICANAHRLPFANGRFDLIICTETLEHVVDPLKVLLEMRRCLSSQGRIIISMDTGSGLFNLVWFFWTKTTGRVWQGAHLHQFKPQQLERLFWQAKLEALQKKLYFLDMAMVFKLRKAELN